MRKFIRHPSEIPIELHFDTGETPEIEPLKDVSLNGLSFCSQVEVPVGTWLKVSIPSVQPQYEAVVRVVWCQQQGNRWDIGVELPNMEDAFRTRMVEQICHIEQYKAKVLATEGRQLSGEQAGQEGIQKFADSFPQLGELKQPCCGNISGSARPSGFS